MMTAFGATFSGEEGCNDPSDLWQQVWRRVTRLQGKTYVLPGGALGRKFVSLLAAEWCLVANGSAKSERPICFGSLMLQRDRKIKKGAEIRRILRYRIDMWKAQQYDELIHEAECSDRQFRSRYVKIDDDHAIKVFTRLMLRGKVREACRFITDRNSGGILDPHGDVSNSSGVSVLDVLKSKHSPQTDANPAAFIDCSDLPPLINVDITAANIERAARRLRGGAGPSGLDATQWQDFLLKYGSHSENLREAMAAVARRIANSVVDWPDIKAMKARRLIALDKCPGVRPIGIGECPDRLCGKAMAEVTGSDVVEQCGSDQLCSGIKAGIEDAIHAISKTFDDNANDGWGVLLIDATNAFNSLSRDAAIWNARVLWPRCSRYLFKSYRGYSMLLIRGVEDCIYSREGVTQDAALSMQLYAIGLLPLIRSLKDLGKWIQNWYADDAECTGEIRYLKSWLEQLLLTGPAFGYYPEPQKSYLIVNDEYVHEANAVFKESGIHVVTSHQFLGGIIGDSTAKESYVKSKVMKWIESVEQLAKAAEMQPQAAYIALTKSLQNEWKYLMRVTHGCEEAFQPLKASILHHFIIMFGFEVSTVEEELSSFPTHLGGLAINDPTQIATRSYKTSEEMTRSAVDFIKTGCVLDIHSHNTHLKKIAAQNRKT